MKDDNKLCFNKTLTYLVLLVAAVVGAFYVMNYANSQKLGSEPRAADSPWEKAQKLCTSKKDKIAEKASNSSWCRYFTGSVKGTFPNPKPDVYGSFCNVAYSTDKSVCAPAKGSSIGVASTPAGCTSNLIVEEGKSKGIISWCRYQTGNKNSSGRCLVNYSDDDTACAAGKGGAFVPPVAGVAPGCTANKITEVGNDKLGKITWCRFETGNKTSSGRCTVGYSDDDTACAAGVGGTYSATSTTCTAGKIVETNDGTPVSWCRYETGSKRANGTCILGYSDDDTACAAGKGGSYSAPAAPAAIDWTSVKNNCASKQGEVVSGSSKTNSYGSLECLVYSGSYKTTGGTAANMDGFCITQFKGGAACL